MPVDLEHSQGQAPLTYPVMYSIVKPISETFHYRDLHHLYTKF